MNFVIRKHELIRDDIPERNILYSIERHRAYGNSIIDDLTKDELILISDMINSAIQKNEGGEK